jgi:hypothetical protein
VCLCSSSLVEFLKVGCFRAWEFYRFINSHSTEMDGGDSLQCIFALEYCFPSKLAEHGGQPYLQPISLAV